MPEVGKNPKNLVKYRSPQGHFEGQDPFPLTVDSANHYDEEDECKCCIAIYYSQ